MDQCGIQALPSTVQLCCFYSHSCWASFTPLLPRCVSSPGPFSSSAKMITDNATLTELWGGSVSGVLRTTWQTACNVKVSCFSVAF